MKWRILIGMGSTAAIIALLSIIAVNEPERMLDFTQSYQARRIETGADLFDTNCSSCHGPQGRGSPLAPALNTPELFNGQRLEAVGFSGTLEDYLSGVIAAGRPIPSKGTDYPERMPTWSQEYGGPLRNDEVNSLVSFIMNWEERALAQAQPTPAGEQEDMMGNRITVELPEGDEDAGQTLAEGPLGCAGCHILAAVGPLWEGSEDQPGLALRADQRINQENYTGEASTPEQYLIESVVLPNVHLVEGYESGIMPADYGERITLQEMADLVAYMLTFR